MKTAKRLVKKRSKYFYALYYWIKLLGINPLALSRTEDLQFSHLGLFYGCLLATIYCYTFNAAFTARNKESFPSETPVAVIVDYMGIILIFLETFITLLVFTFSQERIKIIVKSFIQAEKMSSELGIPEDYEKGYIKIGIHWLILNLIFLASVSFSTVMYHHLEPYNVFVWMYYILGPTIQFNLGMLFYWSLTVIQRKFQRLNVTVELFFEHEYKKGLRMRKDKSGRWNGPSWLVACKGDLRQLNIENKHRQSCNSDILLAKIDRISRLHRELRDAICGIKDHFALPLLVTAATQFTYITLQTYAFYHLIVSEEAWTNRDFIFIAAITHWLLFPLIAMHITSTVCSSTCDEANNTGNVLHKMLNNWDTFEKKQEHAKFLIFSLDLLQNRVAISVLGLLSLDHFFIYSVIASSMTYLMLMLQLYS